MIAWLSFRDAPLAALDANWHFVSGHIDPVLSHYEEHHPLSGVGY
jgi:hypothetical protein